MKLKKKISSVRLRDEIPTSDLYEKIYGILVGLTFEISYLENKY